MNDLAMKQTAFWNWKMTNPFFVFLQNFLWNSVSDVHNKRCFLLYGKCLKFIKHPLSCSIRSTSSSNLMGFFWSREKVRIVIKS